MPCFIEEVISMICDKCGGNKGCCDCHDVNNPYDATEYRMKCSRCGKVFACARNIKGCHGSTVDKKVVYKEGYCTGPCCSDPPFTNQVCWMGTPYFEDWKNGKLRRE